MKQIASYFLCLFFFKLAVGAILLATGWDSLTISENGLINITIIMALSFFPAAFAKPLFQKLNFITIPKLLTFSLCIAGLLIITEYYLMKLSLIGTFITHFILWIFIFIIEVACEKWYVFLSQNHKLQSIRRFSGLSTSLGQLGLILGPVLIILSKKHSSGLPYWFMLVSFFIASLFAFLNTKIKTVILDERATSLNISDNRKLRYIIGFALIWPTLTIFNLSIPVLAKKEYHSINVAGFLEILLALATVIAGLIHPYITKTIVFQKRTLIIFLTLFIATLSIYINNSNIIHLALSIFLLGLTFGYLRIELRAYLSQCFEPRIAGEIISSANSLGGLLVIIYAGVFYLCAQLQNENNLTLIFPISFVLCSALFIYILYYEDKNQNVFVNHNNPIRIS